MRFLAGGVLPVDDALLRRGINHLVDERQELLRLILLAGLREIGELPERGLHACSEGSARITPCGALSHALDGGGGDRHSGRRVRERRCDCKEKMELRS